MMVISKISWEARMRLLFEELKEMQKDCKLLSRWAGIQRIPPAAKWAFLFQESLKKFETDLAALKGFLEKESQC